MRLPVPDRGGAAGPAPPAEGETGRQVRAALSRRRAGQGAAARGSPPRPPPRREAPSAHARGPPRRREEPLPSPAGSRVRLSSGAGAAAAGLFAERWRRAPLAPSPRALPGGGRRRVVPVSMAVGCVGGVVGAAARR